ncbi:ribonuclease H-like domain-containing protein [Tanacetum coccineum]
MFVASSLSLSWGMSWRCHNACHRSVAPAACYGTFSGALVNVKLGCENYRVWATAMKIALQARNKMGFVDGTYVKSTYVTIVPLCNQWERCNAVVLSWLLSSIYEDLYLSQVYSENAAEVWKELKDTYDKLDGTELGKHQQLMKLMQFLMGLDDVYQPIRSSLLTQPELPDVKDAFVIVCQHDAEYDNMRQHDTEYDLMGQHDAEYDNMRQHDTEYDLMGQHDTEYDHTGRHDTKYDHTSPHDTEYDNMRQHDTEYDHMGQHDTEYDHTGQHDTKMKTWVKRY